jgi:hypothetical protein
MQSWLRTFASVVPLLLLPTFAGAHSPIAAEQSGELVSLVEQSNLIALGTVASVTYVNAKDPETGALVPHGIVTYRVRTVLRGEPEGRQLILRFIGGPDGQGRFLKVDGVPLFQPGDTDVLFLESAGDKGCPLVRCEYGRFRVLREQVFDTHGSPVRAIVKNGVVARGLPPAELRTVSYPTPEFDELIKNPEVQAELRRQNLTTDQARERYKAGAPRQMVLGEAFSPMRTAERDSGRGQAASAGRGSDTIVNAVPASASPPVMKAQEFLAVVGRLARVTRRQPAPFRNIDPNAEIRLTALRATEPLLERGDVIPTARPVDAAEREEAAAFEASGGNPVVRR